MPLSEYEQRVLEQMERQLQSEDPRLASSMQSRRSGVAGYVLPVLGVLVGLLALVLGAANSQLWLGVLGFVIMFSAVAFAFSGPRRSGTTGRSKVVPISKARTGRQRKGVMRRFEDRWDRRHEDGA